MNLEVQVHVSCPEDEDAGQPVEAVLRVGEAELGLWRFHLHWGKGFWLRHRFRPPSAVPSPSSTS